MQRRWSLVRWSAGAFLASALASPPCAAADESSRYDGQGFSIVAPSGPGWQLLHRDPADVVYGWRPSGEKARGQFTPTFLMRVVLQKPKAASDSTAFVAAVAEALITSGTEGRFVRISSAARHHGEPGAFCAEYEIVQQERDNPALPGVVMDLEQHGVQCLDRSQKFVVNALTSERRPTGEPSLLDESAQIEAAAFLNSVVVDPVRDAVNPAPGDEPAAAEPPPTPPPALPADAAVYLHVEASYRTAARAAASKATVGPILRFDGEPGAEQCERRIELAFESSVDRSRQMSNRSGATALGVGGLIGVITPWPCPTTYTVTATVFDHSGQQLGAFESHEVRKRIGTMVACPAAGEPGASIVEALVGSILRQIDQAHVLVPSGQPP